MYKLSSFPYISLWFGKIIICFNSLSSKTYRIRLLKYLKNILLDEAEQDQYSPDVASWRVEINSRYIINKQ
jgi:hypothetical protein